MAHQADIIHALVDSEPVRIDENSAYTAPVEATAVPVARILAPDIVGVTAAWEDGALGLVDTDAATGTGDVLCRGYAGVPCHPVLGTADIHMTINAFGIWHDGADGAPLGFDTPGYNRGDSSAPGGGTSVDFPGRQVTVMVSSGEGFPPPFTGVPGEPDGAVTLVASSVAAAREVAGRGVTWNTVTGHITFHVGGVYFITLGHWVNNGTGDLEYLAVELSRVDDGHPVLRIDADATGSVWQVANGQAVVALPAGSKLVPTWTHIGPSTAATIGFPPASITRLSAVRVSALSRSGPE